MPGSGEDPELQSTLKTPPTEEAGLPTELSLLFPNRRWWRHMGSVVQPRLSELNYEKDKHTLTVTSGC